MYEKLYSKITDALVDDGYIIIQNALSSELPHRLLKIAQDESAFKKAGISGAGDLHIDSSRRRDKILWLDEDGMAQSEFLAFTQGLREYLNRTLYLGLSYYEAHFAIYEEGDFYEKHLDTFKNFKNRVVTTVYYLNEAFNESDGGELVVYDEDDNCISKVVPNENTLVVFMSEKFPHEVLPAIKKRYSIAGWYRVDKI
jgi:SM-20-related protein